jgi:hypothetical protein
VTAAPEVFMNESPKVCEERGDATSRPDSAGEQEEQSVFWVWFALGVLLFCWIAEATMCAERGF